MTSSPAFTPPLLLPLSATSSCCSSPRCCARPSSGQPYNRRSFLRRVLLIPLTLLPVVTKADEPCADCNCANCQGSGIISCELCSGTGFWRALAANDPKQKYKGVVCPECEGEGTLRCPVCLGTGEGQIKGLLRRRRIEPGKGRVLQSN